MPYLKMWHSFFVVKRMNAFMIIFFIVLAITIVLYAVMVRRTTDRDEYIKAGGSTDKKNENRSHSPLW
jgi:flagellar biosynthesis/type III secretory pathway M-ring protein FliF/YscJ